MYARGKRGCQGVAPAPKRFTTQAIMLSSPTSSRQCLFAARRQIDPQVMRWLAIWNCGSMPRISVPLRRQNSMAAPLWFFLWAAVYASKTSAAPPPPRSRDIANRSAGAIMRNRTRAIPPSSAGRQGKFFAAHTCPGQETEAALVAMMRAWVELAGMSAAPRGSWVASLGHGSRFAAASDGACSMCSTRRREQISRIRKNNGAKNAVVLHVTDGPGEPCPCAVRARARCLVVACGERGQREADREPLDQAA